VQKVQGPIVEMAAAEKLIDAGKADEAIEMLKRVTAAKPDLAAAQYLLGNAYLKKPDNDAAILAFQRAAALDPRNLNFPLNLGVAYLRKGEPGQAVRQFEEILRRDPKHEKALLDLGIAYYQKGTTEQQPGEAAADYTQSLAALQKALAGSSADKSKIYGWMAVAYLGRNEPAAAIDNAQKALAINANNSVAQSSLCDGYRMNKNWSEAAGCYEKLLAKDPKNAAARKALARVYSLSGQQEKADAVLKAAPAGAASP